MLLDRDSNKCMPGQVPNQADIKEYKDRLINKNKSKSIDK